MSSAKAMLAIGEASRSSTHFSNGILRHTQWPVRRWDACVAITLGYQRQLLDLPSLMKDSCTQTMIQDFPWYSARARRLPAPEGIRSSQQLVLAKKRNVVENLRVGIRSSFRMRRKECPRCFPSDLTSPWNMLMLS